MQRIINELSGDGEFVSLEAASRLLVVLQETKQFDQFAEVIEQMRASNLGIDDATLDRFLADAFATSDSKDLNMKAVDLYRVLIAGGGDSGGADAKHNLATLLTSMDRAQPNPEVEQLWREAYAERPGDMAIRRAFAQYLVRHKSGAHAEDVLAGNPIDDPNDD